MPYYKMDGTACTVDEWLIEKSKAEAIIGRQTLDVNGEPITVTAKFVGLRAGKLYKVFVECSEVNSAHGEWCSYYEEQATEAECLTEFNRVITELGG